MIQIIVKVAESKTGKKFLAVYEVQADKTERFITCDFDAVKRILGLSRWSMIDDKYLEQYEVGQIVRD